MSRGWIKAHAMREESSYYKLTPNYRSVWWELLLWADHHTGIVVISLTHLAKRAGISKQLCRAAILRLVTLKMVAKIADSSSHVQGYGLVYEPQCLKVLNWHKFQGTSDEGILRPILRGVLQEQEVASSTKKRAQPGAPKTSPFTPAFWRVLKRYGTPQLDRADKGQVLARLKAGESLEDIAAKLVVGFAYGAKTGRGALGFTRQFNDPITRLELDDVRRNFRAAAADDRPGDGAGRRAQDPAPQPPSQPGLPGLGATDSAGIRDLRGPGGQAGPVQDDLGLDDGLQSRDVWEASLLDRVGDAPGADGGDAGIAALANPTQEAGGRLEAGRFLDLR